MVVGVIDIGLSNSNSILKAIELKGRSAHIIKNKKDWLAIDRYQKIIFPGVGSFKEAIRSLEANELVHVIKDYCKNGGHYLGICLGMQILFQKGFEGGETEGLGLIPGVVRKITPGTTCEKIPHNGWNEVNWTSEMLCLRYGILDGKDFYFNHSYSAITDDIYVIAKTPYGISGIVSSVKIWNTYGTQFHPEKSQSLGLRILQNFLEKP